MSKLRTSESIYYKMNRTINLYKETENLMNRLEKEFNNNINILGNYILRMNTPEFLKIVKNKNSKLNHYANVLKKKEERHLIIEIGKEQQRKYYFLSRFISKWRHLLKRPFTNDVEKKQMLLKILKNYIEESKSYDNNDETTIRLIKYYTNLKKTKFSLELISDLFELNLLKLDKEQEEIKVQNESKTNNKIENRILQ